MSYKPVWTEERVEWLKEHKDMKPVELLELFNKDFPEVHTTVRGIATKRSELGLSHKRPNSNSGKPRRPLYSEQIKKGYVKIKIAQPSTWEYKQKWVWMETHPELYNTVKSTDIFIFLDGDNRNFNPENIYKLTRGELGTLNGMGGVAKGNPELTLFRIAQVKLKIATLDAGEKIGEVVNYGSGRYFRDDFNEKARIYHREKYKDPQYRAKVKQWREHSLSNMTDEQKEKKKEYQRNWARRKRCQLKV